MEYPTVAELLEKHGSAADVILNVDLGFMPIHIPMMMFSILAKDMARLVKSSQATNGSGS
jgi:hypothetical protein